jgi:3-deoxy-D-manno-octulosonic-acid transferase
MFLLYNLLLTLLAPLWAPWMWWRTARRRERPVWRERFGEYPFRGRPGATRVWVHAVSVGEVVAALPVLRALRAQAPEAEITLTVTTSSGHQTAREKAGGLFDHLAYFPIDVARFQLAALTRVRPHVVAIFETELWFNFLWTAKAIGCRTVLVNGRLSDRSYPRARMLRFFYRPVLRMVDRVLAQTDRDRDRFAALGAAKGETYGNCKFDQALEGVHADPEKWRRELGLRAGLPVVVVGSTRGQEEERLVVEALRGLPGAGCQVVHAPRHLERAEALAAASGGARRSLGQTGEYLVLDTYGELDEAYSVADVVIVGGGFANHGGQNILQPLAHGKPVLHGPHMQNFADVARAAADAGATRTCATAAELREALESLLADGEARARMGRAARAFVAAHAGASERYAAAILAEVPRAELAGG